MRKSKILSFDNEVQIRDGGGWYSNGVSTVDYIIVLLIVIITLVVVVFVL